MFPVFARAREKARQASCSSNLKQIALGMLMYAQDYDDTMVAGSGYQGNSANWQLKIDPYTKNKQIYSCPSRGESVQSYGGAGSFGYANLYFGYGHPWRGGAALGAVTGPAETALTQDGCHPAVDGARGAVPTMCRGFNSCNTTPVTDSHFHHNGGSNVAFWDGHVKWMGWQAMSIQNDNTRSIWRTN